MPHKLNIDLETYSPVDLKKCGAYKYAAHPDTEVLMVSWALGDEEPELWDCTQGAAMPDVLRRALSDTGTQIRAFNATFERLILREVMGVDIPANRFWCTMVHAWSLGFSGGLSQVAAQMGLAQDKQKLSTGGKLINRFCKPAPSNHKAARYTKETHPDEWEQFKAYCRRDVVAEREISRSLEPYPILPQERQMWLVDQDINDRGVPIDKNLVDQALTALEQEKSSLLKKMKTLTGLGNPNSNTQLLPWLQACGVDIYDMQKGTLQGAEKGAISALAQEALALKLQIGKTSGSKFLSMKKACIGDGRVRGMFAFGGAQRTQRWSGRLVQLQNLPQGSLDDPRAAAEALVFGGRDLLVDFLDVSGAGGNVMDALSSCIRPAIKAPEGHKVVVCDLASIESRVLGYLSGCHRINRLFAEGKDTYKDMATQIFAVDYDDVTAEQRKLSKPATLGCFAAGTEVLTDSGWRPIANISSRDRLWDGLEWCRHGGVVYQGEKAVLTKHGVTATPDHLFLENKKWVKWEDLVVEYSPTGIESVPGRYFSSSQEGATCVSATAAGESTVWTPQTSLREKQANAFPVPGQQRRSRGLRRLSLVFLKKISIDLPVGFTPCAPVAPTPRTRATKVMAGEGSFVSSLTRIQQSAISLLSRAGTTLRSKLTGLTITSGTVKAIFVLLTAGGTRQIPASTTLFFIKGARIPLLLSGENLRPNSGIEGLSCGKLEKEKLPKKSLLTKRTAGEPITGRSAVYDVLNVGTRNRFVIRTDYGTAIVHNCGYGLGGPGLQKYAQGFGAKLTEGEAKHQVDAFRAAYPEIPAMWYWLVDTCTSVINGGPTESGYGAYVSRDDNFLMLTMMSGRTIYYYQPMVIQKVPPWEQKKADEDPTYTPKTKPTISYMGKDQFSPQWRRITTHGGKLVENLVQATSRDILADALKVFESRYREEAATGATISVEVVAHVHDEAVALAPEERAAEALEYLVEVFSSAPKWAPGLLLDAAGFITDRYYKG